MSAPPVVQHSSRVADKQPWLGLASYGEADSELFFGREREAAELLRCVRREVLTILFGPSGTGKTSLLNAGLFPRLRHAGILPVLIRLDHSGSEPNYAGQIRASLAQALRSDASRIEEEAFAPPQTPPDEETLWEYLHRVVFWDWRNNPVTPVLVLDQFEEIFTVARNQAATEAFFVELADLVENYIPLAVRSRIDTQQAFPFWQADPRYKVVLTLREDFVSRLDGLRKALPSVMHNRYPIARMNGEQALLAVREPGRGIVEEPVACRIVRFVAAANEPAAGVEGKDGGLGDLQVDPALLSVVCRELNTRRIAEEKPLITDDLLQQAGADILNDFYERCYAGLGSGVRVFVEDRLLTASGYRSTVPLEEATQAGFTDEIRILMERRLIRAEERLGIPHLELTHDLLTKVVLKSRAERQERDREEREQRQREAEEAERIWRDRRRLQELRRARRLLALVSGSAVIFLLLAGLAGISYRRAEAARAAMEIARKTATEEKAKAEVATIVAQTQEQAARTASQKAIENAAAAIAEQRESKARELAAHAVESLTEDPERAILLGMYAIDATRHYGQPVVPAAEDVLHRAILSSRMLLTLRHAQDVYGVDFSRDGKRVATGSKDRTAKIWDATTGQELLTLTGHTGAVRSLAFSPDGSRLATASEDKTAKIWDTGTGKEMLTLAGHSGMIWAVVFSPDGKHIATASADGTVKIWMSATGESALTVNHGPTVYSVAFSPDGQRLALGDEDKVDLLDGSNGQKLLTIRSGMATGLAFYGEKLAVSGYPAVWDSRSGKELLRLRGHVNTFSPRAGNNPVTSVAFSPDERIATASSDKTVKLWDAENGAELLTLRGHTNTVWRAVFDRDGRRLATASSDGTAKVWDVAAGRELFTLPANGDVVFSSNGKRFAAASRPAGVYETATGKTLLDLRIPNTSEVGHVGFSPDGTRIATADRNYESMSVWDASSGKLLLQLTPGDNLGVIVGVVFSADGRRIAAATGENTAVIWDARDGRELLRVHGSSTRETRGVALSPDGTRVATVSPDTGVKIWDADTGKEQLTLPGPVGPSTRLGPTLSLVFSPSGKRLAVGSKVWDAFTGRELMALRGAGTILTYSPDGKRVAGFPVRDNTVYIWDGETGQELLHLAGHSEPITGAAFSPDGKVLAVTNVSNLQFYAADIDGLLALARKRVSRTLTAEECKRYFQTERCPDLP